MLTLSASQVNAYLGCPLKYRFRYVDRIPPPWRPAALAFGGSVHAAAEWLHKERIAGRQPTAEEVLRIFNADWFAQNLDPLVFGDRESKDELTEKGQAMLATYVEAIDGAVPRSVEERFEIDLVDPVTGEVFDLRLVGVVDLVEEDGTVVDLKTAARVVSQADLDRHLQLSIYALAAFVETGAVPKLRLDVLLKTKVPRLDRRSTTRSLDDLGWTARLVHGVGRAIENGHFFPNPSWRCTECEYFGNCQAWQGE
jgi:putative RecB family exonuclease